jgi:hypothetical protein
MCHASGRTYLSDRLYKSDQIHTDASELLALTLTAIAMSGESCSDEPESGDGRVGDSQLTKGPNGDAP